MPNASTTLTDLQVQHALHLLRVGNGVSADVLKLLQAMERDISEKIAQRLITIKERGHDIGPKTTERLNTMLVEIRSLVDPVYGATHEKLKTALTEIATNEAKFQTKALEAASPVKIATRLPAPTLLATIATDRPIAGKLLEPMVKGMGDATKDRIEQQIRLGIAAGENTDKIVARVMGVEGLEKSKEGVRTMVRTSINSVANQASQETWKANADLIDGWRFVATLDSRTTLICASNDGHVFPLGEGPIPPLHLNCRSTSIASIKDNKHAPTIRASVDGPVKNRNFEAWLKDQPEDRQLAILGPTRLKLWTDGQTGKGKPFNLMDFVRDNNEVISIAELKTLHPDAFATVAGTISKVADVLKPVAPVVEAFTSPINADVNENTIKVLSRKEANATLTKQFADNAADPRYDPRPEFRNAKATDFGKASMIGDFTDEAASMIAALQPELDAMSKAFGIPKLRAIKTGAGQYIATMGDGILTLNPTYFNVFAQDIGGGVTKIASQFDKIKAEHDAITAELQAMSDRLGKLKVEMRDLTGAAKEAAMHRYLDEAEAFNAKRQIWLKLDKKLLKARTAERLTYKQVANWKPGDPTATRPYNANDYFASGLEKARMTIFHEFAHHIHQMYRKSGRRNAVGAPPFERELSHIFRAVVRRDRVASSYGTKNAHEWWAESFGLFMMGRRDLVDETVIALIERLLSEVASGH